MNIDLSSIAQLQSDNDSLSKIELEKDALLKLQQESDILVEKKTADLNVIYQELEAIAEKKAELLKKCKEFYDCLLSGRSEDIAEAEKCYHKEAPSAFPSSRTVLADPSFADLSELRASKGRIAKMYAADYACLTKIKNEEMRKLEFEMEKYSSSMNSKLSEVENQISAKRSLILELDEAALLVACDALGGLSLSGSSKNPTVPLIAAEDEESTEDVADGNKRKKRTAN